MCTRMRRPGWNFYSEWPSFPVVILPSSLDAHPTHQTMQLRFEYGPQAETHQQQQQQHRASPVQDRQNGHEDERKMPQQNWSAARMECSLEAEQWIVFFTARAHFTSPPVAKCKNTRMVANLAEWPTRSSNARARPVRFPWRA